MHEGRKMAVIMTLYEELIILLDLCFGTILLCGWIYLKNYMFRVTFKNEKSVGEERLSS